MHRLNNEKEQAYRDYEQKVNGQDRSISLAKQEIEEQNRLLINKDSENSDLLLKISGSREKI